MEKRYINNDAGLGDNVEFEMSEMVEQYKIAGWNLEKGLTTDDEIVADILTHDVREITVACEYERKENGNRSVDLLEIDKLPTKTRQQRIERYSTMYAQAQAETFGYYKGYTGANALSLWVDEKYGVNAAADGEAYNALFEYIQLINDPG